MMNWLVLLVLIFIITSIYIKFVYSYWTRHGFPETKPRIPFGCMFPFVKGQKNALASMAAEYYKSTEAFVGIYVFFVPQLIIRDLDLVRRVLITDFEYFHDRDAFINEKLDPLSVNVFTQKGTKWKHLRQLLTPLFTSGKLKNMFVTVNVELEKLDKHLDENVGKVIELRETLTNSVLNIIASVFFGLDVDCVSDPNHYFKHIFELTSSPRNVKDILRQSSSFFFPQ